MLLRKAMRNRYVIANVLEVKKEIPV